MQVETGDNLGYISEVASIRLGFDERQKPRVWEERRLAPKPLAGGVCCGIGKDSRRGPGLELKPCWSEVLRNGVVLSIFCDNN